ncbi:lysophospholipase [Sphaerosporella brunnea]|uniref:Lysophospholipase n=1 Tax=Sphaerosporella brunnea TaxID=1250544 RepID=A0A5J5ES34_9PEZI|nr:lysophospholipase [Sphaerosporella brunnea]
MTDFDVVSFIDSYSPTVALAFSGGGYRAMLSGAGAVKAMDIRTPGTSGPKQVGGLLQSATYLAGLSGGSWLLESVIVNNFTTIGGIQASKNLWDLEHNILVPDSLSYYSDIRSEVKSKEEAGFDITLTDYWARALSRQFLNWTDGGPGVTFSSVALTDEYKNADIPFPIIVADERRPGQKIISKNATVFEFNPLEFGSFDPTVFAFTPLEYLGTNMTKGVPVEGDVCIRGFDNAGYVMGTSSSLFNQILLNLNSSGLQGVSLELAQSVLTGLSTADYDIADYAPNPFFGINPNSNPSSNTRNLTLVDGGEDLQNIPLHPLIQPSRKVDVIFAFDNSADTLNHDGSTSNWPNGTAMVATYERALDSEISNGTLFPHIPDVNTFVNLGLNRRPTFFGCDGANITASHPGSAIPPLVVYMPNSPWTYKSNISTFTMSYSHAERDNMIQNGFNIASQGNGTQTDNWPACIGCAIVHRQQERTGATQSAQCKQCFAEYCWNGTLKSEVPPQYDPKPYIQSGAAKYLARGYLSVFVAVIVAALL